MRAPSRKRWSFLYPTPGSLKGFDMTFVHDLRQRVFLLGQNFPGYEDVLTQALFALLTREHMLWYSKPGRAKTQVAGSLFDLFADAPVFRKQLTKDTMKEELFGNVVVDNFLKTGREVYNLENGVVEATFAYLDEFFDGSDFLLRALLNLLNEREFHARHHNPPVGGAVRVSRTLWVRLRGQTALARRSRADRCRRL